ncbi:MAG TPA: hypothetical protein VIR62_09920 [Allosphingosinicella sp.]
MERKQATQMIFEMQEFAALSAAEQRFICRSLDVAAWGADATTLWSRSPIETASIKAQNKLYRTLLEVIRNSIPDDFDINAMTEIIGLLITISAFDLGEGKIECFSAYHFLYERLLGPSVRPWLPSAFVGAASLPYLHPSLRKALLSSITAGEMAAIDWSNFDPVFFPEWVDEVEITPSQP